MVPTLHLRGDAVPAELAGESLGAGAPIPELVGVTMRMTQRAGRQWFALLLSASTYLEWGSGGSTVLAAWLAVQDAPPLNIVSVDSSRGWVDQLRARHPVVRSAEAAGRLALRIADLGAVGAWGYPERWRSRSPELQRSQSAAYVEMVNASLCCFDLVLVDGRFRVACLLHALRLVHNRTIVLLHDAPRYLEHPAVRMHYRVVVQSAELAALRPRAGAIEQARLGSARWSAQYRDAMTVALR